MSLSSLYIAQIIMGNKPRSNLGIACLGLIISFLIYNMYIVQNFGLIRLFLTNIFEGFKSLSFFSESGRIIGTFSNELSYYSSWVIVFINIIGFGVTLILNIIRRIKIDLYTAYLSINIIMLGIFGVMGRYGEHEAYQRAFMFGLLPLTYFSVNLMRRKVYVLIILIISLMYLNIPAQYGSDTFRLATEKQHHGSSFFAFNTPDEITAHGQFSLYVRYYYPTKHIEFKDIPGTSFPITHIPKAADILDTIYTTDYTILSELTYNFIIYYYGKNLYDEVNLNALNRIYDNSGYEIFKPDTKN